MIQVTYAEIESVLQDLGATMTAAEGHGYLSGALCASTDYTCTQWLSELVPEESTPVPPPSEQPLSLLATDTIRAIRGDEMEFEPFLPDDDVTLQKRAAALSEWCEGFLYGFSATAGSSMVLPKNASLPENVGEVLHDLAEISRVEVGVEEGGEEAEQFYSDIVEHVRVGVQLIHDELQSQPVAPKPSIQ